MKVPTTPPRNVAEMAYCESAYQVISIWLWLSMRFSEAFPNPHVAQVCKRQQLWGNAQFTARVRVCTVLAFLHQGRQCLSIASCLP